MLSSVGLITSAASSALASSALASLSREWSRTLIRQRERLLSSSFGDVVGRTSIPTLTMHIPGTAVRCRSNPAVNVFLGIARPTPLNSSSSLRDLLPPKRHSSSSSVLSKYNPSCPFRTLRISPESTFAAAKKSFLRIAMSHHPDTLDADVDDDNRKKSMEIFMSSRSAFEKLVECGETGACLLREKVGKSGDGGGDAGGMTDEQFDSWFKSETGRGFDFDMDPETMREVADMHDEMHGSNPGLDRDGGMWHLASLVSKAVKNTKGGGAASILKLEAGAGRPGEGGGETKGSLGRRRRQGRGIIRR